MIVPGDVESTLAEPPKDFEAVREVHAQLAEKPAFDVTYLTAAELASPPSSDKPVAYSQDGVFRIAPSGRGNLESYWAGLFDQLEAAMEARPDDQEAPEWVLPWVMLGVPRLHALLATGNIVSKTAAGEHESLAL
jgi:hypothetical protein